MNFALILLITSIIIVAGCIDATGPIPNQTLDNQLQQGPVEIGNEMQGSAMIAGQWYQTGRGNGAKIWYDFHPEGTFTFNYDMRGNRDSVMSRGRWAFLGNSTFQLVPDIPQEPDTHGNENITISSDGRSFHSGTEYQSGSVTRRDIVFEKD